MTRKDWLLLAVSGREGTDAAPIDPLRLMKTLFVAGQQLDLDSPDFYRFVAYSYGPFAREIYPDLDQLEYEELIEAVPNPGRTWPRYRATLAGSEYAAALVDGGGLEAGHLLAVRDWAVSISFRDLLRAVYQQWPEFAENSIARV